MASFVEARSSKAVEARSEAAKHGLARQSCLGSASCVVAWQSGCVESRFGMARNGRAVTARETIDKSERRQYASIYKQIFISQRL